MDAKEVKAKLKSAREAIRNKDYKEALASCKAVLKNDKANYNAWVFVGVAAEGLEQGDQALNAYKKAIETDEEQPLAWQGLCGFYEKSNEGQHKKELVAVYDKLLTIFDKDNSKKAELGEKLAALYRFLSQNEEAVRTYMRVLEWLGDDQEKAGPIWAKIIQILKPKTGRTEQQNALLQTAYKSVLYGSQAGSSDQQETWNDYLNLLMQMHAGREKVECECKAMVGRYPDAPLPHQLTCLVHLDQAALEPFSAMVPDVSSLQQVEPESGLVALTNGLAALKAANLKEAHNYLQQGVSSEADTVCGWLLLAQLHLKMHDRHGIDTAASKGLKLLKSEKARWTGDSVAARRVLEVTQAWGKVMAGGEKALNHAMDICNKILSEDANNVNATSCSVSAQLLLGNTDDAAKGIEKLQGVRGCGHYKGWLMYELGEMDKAKKSLEMSCVRGDGGGQTWYWLARVYWRLIQGEDDKVKEACHANLLKAAKLDPYYAPTFLLLGHYYKQILKDQSKARRCYQKAYDLDPEKEESGISLADALVATGDDAGATSLLKQVTSQATAGGAKWAWLRQGLQQLKEDDPSAAILSLQAALRADPKDVQVWECLGEAYYTRGSYNAALKAFTKATELNPEALYCKYMIGSINQTVGQHAEAVQAYDQLLHSTPEYVPALKGLSETHLSLAREGMRQYFHGRAVDHCQQAISHLTKAVSQRSDLSCLWKLLGDACTLLNSAPDEIAQVSVPGRLLSSSSGLDDKKTLDKTGVLRLGGRCYGMALKQQPDCAPLWHDLALNYFYQSQIDGAGFGKQLAWKAVQALQKALSLDAKKHRHWTALGVVAASKDVDHLALAQHCFIKSIEVENNVSAWTNLGTLYLKTEQVELAHQAFKQAQSLDPGFVASWIGQALIAETVGHEDAMDLFRHTTELAINTEGSIGYAWWVCATLQDKTKMEQELWRYSIQDMSAVPAACDAMAHYTDRVRNNAQAFNMYGLLLERMKLYKSAADALQSAVKLLEGDKKQTEAKLNLARVLCESGQYSESVSVYESTKEHMGGADYSWLGLTAYRANKLDVSLTAYESALSMTEVEEDRSHVQAAIGMVLYKMGDTEGAKSAFFKGFQSGCPSVHGLRALCSLGLLQSDTTLVTAALQELSSRAGSDDIQADEALLKAQLHAIQGQENAGCNLLVDAVHSRPWDATRWQHLSLYMMQHQQHRSNQAARCAQAVYRLKPQGTKLSASLLSVSSSGGGLHSRRDANNNCLSAAQKAVHLHPDSLSNWCGLLTSMYAENQTHQETSGTKLHHAALGLAAYLMSQIESDLTHNPQGKEAHLRALHLWSVQQYIVLLLQLGRVDQAKQFIQSAIWLYESDPVLRSLSAFLEENFKIMRASAKEANKPYLWQILVQALQTQGLMGEVEKSLNNCRQSAESNSSRQPALLQLAYLAYTKIMAGGDADKWRTLLVETGDEVERLDPGCVVVKLLHAAVELNNKNTRLAKRLFQQCIDNSSPVGLPYIKTLARIQLYYILKDKDKDGPESEAMQILVADALEEDDKEFMDVYYN